MSRNVPPSFFRQRKYFPASAGGSAVLVRRAPVPGRRIRASAREHVRLQSRSGRSFRRRSRCRAPVLSPFPHCIYKGRPLVGEAFGDQPRPRVDEGAAEALRLEVAQHPVDVGAGDLCVPDPQGRRAKCPRGIGEFLSELLEFHFPFLGGCGVAGEARCRQGGRQQAFDCGGFGFHGRSGLCLLYKGKGYVLRAVTNPDKRLFISDKACGGWRGRTGEPGGSGRDAEQGAGSRE